MKAQRKRFLIFSEAVIMIAILQGLRELIEYLLLKTVPESQFAHKMVTMAAMIFLTFVVLIYAKLTKTKLTFFPARFSKGYIIITCVAAAVFIRRSHMKISCS